MFREGLLLVVVPGEHVEPNRDLQEVVRSVLENISDKDFESYKIQHFTNFWLCGGLAPDSPQLLRTAELANDVSETKKQSPRLSIPPIFQQKHTWPIGEITDEHLEPVEGIVFHRTPSLEERVKINGLTPAEKLHQLFPHDFAVLVDAHIRYPYDPDCY